MKSLAVSLFNTWVPRIRRALAFSGEFRPGGEVDLAVGRALFNTTTGVYDNTRGNKALLTTRLLGNWKHRGEPASGLREHANSLRQKGFFPANGLFDAGLVAEIRSRYEALDRGRRKCRRCGRRRPGLKPHAAQSGALSSLGSEPFERQHSVRVRGMLSSEYSSRVRPGMEELPRARQRSYEGQRHLRSRAFFGTLAPRQNAHEHSKGIRVPFRSR